MGLYLLDTDAVIDYLVGFAPSVDLIRSIHTSGNDLGVCDVVVAEVYSGLRPEDCERTAALLEALQFLTTAADAARVGVGYRTTMGMGQTRRPEGRALGASQAD